tara:strand:- start:226 stop:354 length:129 start_codon:yes stop_codon:yes gene_type:complete
VRTPKKTTPLLSFVCLFVFVSSSRRAQFGRRGRNGFEEAKKR